MKSLAEIEAEVVAALKTGAADVLKDQLEHHPDSFFATLRKVRPILHVPNGPVFVTLFQDVQEVLSRPEVFNVTYAPKMDPSVGPFMLARDGGTINERDKGIMRAMLRREDLPRVRETVAGLAAAAVRAGYDLGLSVHPIPTGPSAHCFRIAPPLTATTEEIDRAVELLGAALDQVA
jgi:cytochrome P450